MALQLSTAVRTAMIAATETTTGTAPLLRLRTGSPPANPAASRTGTVLASLTLPSDWMTQSGGVGSLAGSWTGTGLAAAGAGTAPAHFEIMDSGGSTCHFQGTVTTGGNTAWATSTAYVVGQRRVAGGNLYQCSSAGTSASSGSGPTGTGTVITDGTAAWNYVSAVGDMTIDGASIAEGQTFTVSTFTLTAGNA